MKTLISYSNNYTQNCPGMNCIQGELTLACQPQSNGNTINSINMNIFRNTGAPIDYNKPLNSIKKISDLSKITQIQDTYENYESSFSCEEMLKKLDIEMSSLCNKEAATEVKFGTLIETTMLDLGFMICSTALLVTFFAKNLLENVNPS